MIQQFFVLSPRGDTIVSRDFRGNGVQGAAEIFFRRVKEADRSMERDWTYAVPSGGTSGVAEGFLSGAGGLPTGDGEILMPVMFVNDICFVHVKKSRMFFVITAKKEAVQQAEPGKVTIPMSLWIELLDATVRIIKDFCGILNEVSVRKNFALVYEVVDEIFDFGFPQTLKTSELSNVVRNEAQSAQGEATGYAALISQSIASLSSIGSAGLAALAQTAAGQAKAEGIRNTIQTLTSLSSSATLPRTVPSNASQAPIAAAAIKELPGGGPRILTAGTQGPSAQAGQSCHDVFIDIVDRITADIAATGGATCFLVDGTITIKSYLSENLDLRLGLNEDLIVRSPFFNSGDSEKTVDKDFWAECRNRPTGFGNTGGSSALGGGAGGVEIDDCLFHECVDLKEFGSSKALLFSPPQGEFTLMKYRVKKPQGAAKLPIGARAAVSGFAKNRIEVVVAIRPEVVQKGMIGVAAMNVQLPPWITGGSLELLGNPTGQLGEIQPDENKISWSTKRLNFNNPHCEVGFRAKLDVDCEAAPKIFVQALRLAAAAKDIDPACSSDVALATFPSGLTPDIFIAQYFGPASVGFELPMYSSAMLQIRYLRLAAHHGTYQEPPRRWVRYATQSSSYTVRFS